MWYTILFTLAIVAASIALLGIKVFFFKGKNFPNTHIGGNPAMKKRGIVCAATLDRRERGNRM